MHYGELETLLAEHESLARQYPREAHDLYNMAASMRFAEFDFEAMWRHVDTALLLQSQTLSVAKDPLGVEAHIDRIIHWAELARGLGQLDKAEAYGITAWPWPTVSFLRINIRTGISFWRRCYGASRPSPAHCTGRPASVACYCARIEW